MKFGQDLCLNLQYDFGKMNSTLGSVVPLAMFDCGKVLEEDMENTEDRLLLASQVVFANSRIAL